MASGDFNGDGFSDLAVSVPGKNAGGGTGAVIIIYGSPNGLTNNLSTTAGLRPQYFDVSSLGLQTLFAGLLGCFVHTDGFGQSLAWGDFNGDGVGDLAIGFPGFDEECLTFPGPIHNGALIFLVGTRTKGLTLTDSSGLVGTVSGERLGSTLTSGDFNGDGFSDLAAGGVNANNDEGEVDVFYGSKNFPVDTSPQIWSKGTNIPGTPAEGDLFGAALAAGDFNGDGKADLAIGVPGDDFAGTTDAGRVHVIYGSASGLTATGNQIWDQDVLGRGRQANAQFGLALAAGDFNGDGRTDLAIGVPLRDIGSFANAGEVDIIYGAAGGLSITAGHAPQFWTQDTALGAGNTQAGNRFGASLTAWNFGRNEIVTILGLPFLKQMMDLAIGAPFQSVNGVSGAGAVNVLYGSFSSNGLVNTNRQIFNADNTNIGGPQSGAHFGAALY